MYYLYILECADCSLYTGITVDIERRVEEHNSSKLGAKYTSARRPVRLVYSASFDNRSLASKEEYRIKKLSRDEKLELVKSFGKNFHSVISSNNEKSLLASSLKIKNLNVPKVK